MSAVGDFLASAVPGMTTVLVCIHAGDCSECTAFLDRLAASSDEFRIWDARLITDRRNSPSVIVADRYGQIFYVSEAGPGHHFPAPRELEEWLKFLGTLCPE